MNYELALKLKEAGFPQSVEGKLLWEYNGRIREVSKHGSFVIKREELVLAPSLPELIGAIGDNFRNLNHDTSPEWQANAYKNEHGGNFAYGKTPEEAVANLWLSLNNKNNVKEIE